MKQLFLILIFVLISLGEIFAQDFKKFNYQLGLGTTLTIPCKKTIELWPEFDGHPKTDYASDFGYFFEFLISYNLNSKYSIMTGLNYNYSSVKIDDKIGLIQNKGNLTSAYFAVPILIKYHLFDKIPIAISAGPYLSFLVKVNEKGISYTDTAGFVFAESDPIIESIEPKQKYNTDIKNDYTSIDYGLSLQFDYEIRFNDTFSGVILTRFNCGLKDVITNDLLNNNTASDWKNYSLMIGFGLKL